MLNLSSPTTFDAWLKHRRKTLGLSRRELAERVGCAAITIVKIEAGERRPSRQIAELLAASLDIPEAEQDAFVEFARVGENAPTHGQLLLSVLGEASHRSSSQQRPHNLPVQRTTFIGRAEQVTAVVSLLSRSGTRLLTLNGPPGIGKTRMSVQVGMELLHSFEHGVCFVALAPVTDPHLMPSTIAQALGLRETGSLPVADMLTGYLRDRELLLVLDNFEQVTPAAPVIGELLAAAPGLKVLVTSREMLHLYGEHDFPVPPMAVPPLHVRDADVDLASYEATRLFLERAATASYGFQATDAEKGVIAEICARLDGLPLAIELAAALVRDLSLAQIASQLNSKLSLLSHGPVDLPARQRTLRGAIAWSYDLLHESEQTLFLRMSVFVGGCTLEAAQAVIASTARDESIIITDPLSGDELSLMLTSLVDKSLLKLERTAEGPRYWMLETIREYAGEMLAESGATVELAQRHSVFYLALAEEALPRLIGTEQGEWLERLNGEHDNFRAALASSLRREDAETALRLGAALWKFWLSRGYLNEGWRWLSLALAQSTDVGSNLKLVRGGALKGAGNMAFSNGDYTGARALYEESLLLHKEAGDRLGMAQLLNNLSVVELTEGRYDRVMALCEESLALKRELGDKLGTAATLGNLALMLQDRGDYEGARPLHEESLSIRRGLGDKRSVAIALNGLGATTLALGDAASARRLHEESLALGRELDDNYVVALSMIDLGEAARYENNYAEARRCYEQGLAIQRELGHMQDLAIVLHNLGQLACKRGDTVEAKALLSESLSIRSEARNQRGIVECLAAFGNVAVAEGQYERAARLYGAAAGLIEVTGFQLYPVDRAEFEAGRQAAKSHLGDAAYAAQWNIGRALSVEEAIKYAL